MPTSGPPGRDPGRTAPGTEKKAGFSKVPDGGMLKNFTAGLPTTEQGLARIGFCIAPSNSNRLYATVEAGKYGGIYRSDDAGENRQFMNPDERLWGRGNDFAEVKRIQKRGHRLYSRHRYLESVDAGKTWSAFGALGGDDYHRIWINPNDPRIMLIATDQGAPSSP